MSQTTEVAFVSKFEQAVALAESIGSMAVKDAASYAKMGETVAAVRKAEGEMEAEYKTLPVIIEAKRLQEAKGELARKLEGARRTGKNLMFAYEKEEEDRRLAEERRLQEEARKAAEDEALKAALAAEKAGDNAAAQAVLDEPVAIPTVVLPKATPKVKGHSRKKVWDVRITNEAAVPREFLMVDTRKLKDLAGALKKVGEIAPGVEAFYNEV